MIVPLEWASEGRKALVYQKGALFLLGEDKISHFQSPQLHFGNLKKTVLPYEERQEHSWKKNDCCTAWMNVIPPHSCCSSSLHRREPEIFVFSGSPSASCLNLHRRFRCSHLLWMQNLKNANNLIIIRLKFQWDLDWNDSFLFIFFRFIGSEIDFYRPFAVFSWVKGFGCRWVPRLSNWFNASERLCIF